MSRIGHTQLGEVCEPLDPTASSQPTASALSNSASIPELSATDQRDRPPADSSPASPSLPRPGSPSKTAKAQAAQPKWNEVYSFDPSLNRGEIERWEHDAFLEGSYQKRDLHHLWDQLNTRMHSFICLVRPRKCMWHLLDDRTKDKLTSFCPIAARIIEDDKKGCHHLMLAWIWRIVYDNLLSPDCTDKWSNEEWAHLGSFQQSLRKGGLADESNPFTHAYHAAKFSSVRMAYMRFGPHSSVARLEKIILDEFLPMMKLRNHPDNQVDISDSEPGSEPEIDPETGLCSMLDKLLSRVAQLAVEVDFWILASGKNVKVDFLDPETGAAAGFPFKPDHMKAESNLLRKSEPPAIGALPGFVDFYKSAFGNHHKCTETSKMLVVVDHFNEYKVGQASTAFG
ncbi:unnamed protein product [Clonostachys rosea]|uniref:Uncharacterized protein n=1 Tax=Bionectria ochroleuca TaxID=29856 RepID=A0ABY6UAL1_BIOOC|nr:unnamed protein product [Clonostachys rosea]